MKQVQHKPSEVNAVEGQVIVDGPDGIAYAMTPEAATRTSARLLTEAARAKGQAAQQHATGVKRAH
ncbi:hypothetical protein FPZ24_11385 [Sphingomonas panacisoli]|uniref:Uncharacterized protein n=1 Tax=Sphingomonas panacisoli TaxID=1813879 RepID=A0A5B8LIE4_9SPHN|nr:hypothetical protein [Sphingomonas panacisoli]QDZ08008.1 hypothetical protein FPZ24_11385 [Sphingomonas panacisoli]